VLPSATRRRPMTCKLALEVRRRYRRDGEGSTFAQVTPLKNSKNSLKKAVASKSTNQTGVIRADASDDLSNPSSTSWTWCQPDRA